MVKIRENGATSGIGVLATYGYDDLGRRSSLTLGNGESASYSYDPVSRLSQLSRDLGGSAATNDLNLGFAYNPASQIVSTTRSNDLYAWTGHGSGTTGTSANGLNQIASWNATLAYDAKGNLASDGTRTYTYDSENRLADTSSTIPYYYDPLGRLAGAGSPLAIHYENYVDGLIAERLAGSSGVSFRHVFGPDTDEPIVWYVGSGTNDRRFLHADERGSIVAVTDSSANLRAINRYDEYGRTETTSSTYMGRFLYTGQRYFGASGLYYYKNRFYRPDLVRFMQTDPGGYDDGMNLYIYVGGDPVNATDPSGKEACTGSRINLPGPCNGALGGGLSGFSTAGFGPRGGPAGSGEGKDTANNPGKGDSKNVALDLLTPIQIADASGWGIVLERVQTAGKWTLKGAGAIATAGCFLLSNACGLEEQRLSLYRVVDATELSIIRATGTYGFNPNRSGKYFGFSRVQTENLFNTIYKHGGSLTEITLPTRIAFQGHQFNDPGGAGPSVHFSDQQLPMVYRYMSPIHVIFTR